MKEQELYDLLKDQQDILLHINQRLDQMERSINGQRDYSQELEYIAKELEHQKIDETKTVLKRFIQNQANYNVNLLSAISEQNKMQTNMINELPAKVRVRVEHNITASQRPYILFGVCLLIASSLAFFFSIEFWQANGDLRDGNIKLRMVRLLYPNVWVDVDTTFRDSPAEVEKWIIEEEERLIAIKKAEEIAKRSNAEASRAKTELRRLKQKKNDSK